ncbi:hypothetical protein [Nocardioides sp. URHA0020]|uniref:hypothetical protein n=1 Tax=Nocardioides sp. URHA0020 TaxID=1380392 RepID=UPI000490743C|nr:hypothetical protein [Nocardioides sp. URHA0020]
MKLAIVATLTAAALGATLVAAPAAQAEQRRYADPADAAASLTDIRAVKVDHGARTLAVTVRFTDLRRRSDGGPASLTIGIDTRSSRPGAEFRLVSGLQEGTDYQLMRVRHGRVVGEPLTCGHRVRLDFAHNRLRFVGSRTCLGSPARARIAVLMRDEWDASHPITDWLGARRSYTAWLASS